MIFERSLISKGQTLHMRTFYDTNILIASRFCAGHYGETYTQTIS